jgi:hypothetical protein
MIVAIDASRIALRPAEDIRPLRFLQLPTADDPAIVSHFLH